MSILINYLSRENAFPIYYEKIRNKEDLKNLITSLESKKKHECQALNKNNIFDIVHSPYISEKFASNATLQITSLYDFNFIGKNISPINDIKSKKMAKKKRILDISDVQIKLFASRFFKNEGLKIGFHSSVAIILAVLFIKKFKKDRTGKLIAVLVEEDVPI